MYSKTVIFLGAGASKADGAPMQSELFKSYFTSLKVNDGGARYDNTRKLVKRYFREFFALDVDAHDINDIKFPTFEEALGVLDLAIKRNERYSGIHTDIEKYKEALVFSMAKAIEFELEEKYQGWYPEFDKGYYHNMMVKNLYKELKHNEITLISTNYDLLIDNALINNGFTPSYEVDEPENVVTLLKIHGSLNWQMCTDCKKLYTRRMRDTLLDIDYGETVCEGCQESLESIIVPPTYFKDMTNPHLVKCWEDADAKLTCANHIIFCGYSFPDADIHLKYLIKRAELNGQREAGLKVTVLNSHYGKTKAQYEAEKKKYSTFLSKDTELIFREDVSFQDFAKNPHRFMG